MSAIHRTAAWARLARRAKDEAGWRCTRCGGPGALEVCRGPRRRFKRRALEADHVRPVAQGGAPLDPANVRVLCRDCHIRKHRRARIGPEGVAWDRAVSHLKEARA